MKKPLSLIMVLVMLVSLFPAAAADQTESPYAGKVISVLGDSISTFAGYIPTADGFNLEHLPRYPQDDLLTDVNETWWMQVISGLGAKLGINDSWRGATVSGAAPVTSGTTGENAALCNLTRIQNLGSNGTPDVILFYGGTNDLAHVAKVGTFDPATAPETVDLTTKKWDNLADGYVHTLLRLQHFYPRAQIVCLLPTYTASYYSDTKLAQGNAVLAAICEYYGVSYVDLRETGVTAAHLPDGIHPGEEGMDLISEGAIALMTSDCRLEPGENIVHSVTHVLNGVVSSAGHIRGISDGSSFEAALVGENISVNVTMGGVDITDLCYADSEIYIEAVSGPVVITAGGDVVSEHAPYLQTLPDGVCSAVNLWKLLEWNHYYYTASGWGIHSSGKVTSITIPVTPGERIWATSFGAAGSNGGTINGIRVTWFGPEKVLNSVGADAVFDEFSENGYLSVPEGAVAVNVPMWTGDDSNGLYLLDRDHSYENGVCAGCGRAEASLTGKTISILGDSISTYTGVSNDPACNPTLENGAVYYNAGTLGVYRGDTWWQQAIDTLGLELLVNNSWSGSCILNTRSGSVGAYIDRCVQLHNTQGKEPDIIAIYLGTNDFCNYKSTLGSSELDYDKLITKNEDGSFTYANPATACEAYAIMLHKMTQRYPNAEVYCFTLLPQIKLSADQQHLLELFNDSLSRIGERFGAYTVDLYGSSGIRADQNFSFYVADNSLHPGPAGMDAITGCFASALFESSAYVAEPVHEIAWDLTDVLADQGTAYAIRQDDSFFCSFTAPTGYALDVTVTMAGEDITAECYKDAEVSIASVSGDLAVRARAYLPAKDPGTYRWEFDGTDLVSVSSDENALTRLSGTVTNGVHKGSRFRLGQTLMLYHQRPWAIEWRSEGSWTDTTDGALLFAGATASSNADTPYLYRRHRSDFIALGVYTGGQYHNYGVELGKYGIDATAEHTYRLENRIQTDGSNMVFLLVDGNEVGPLNHHWIGGTDKKETVDWVNGRDFAFSYMGTNPHTIGNCSIDYIQVEECVHSYQDGICTWCGRVCNLVNRDTGVGYQIADEALTAAKPGETVVLLADVSERVLMIPAGVTFDLNGHVAEAGNVLSFGVVMDSAEEVGGIRISSDTTQAFTKLQPDNGGYLPVYDTRDGMYKFFAFELIAPGTKTDEKNRAVFGFKILFENMEAYEVLANSTDSCVSLSVNFKWVGLGSGFPYIPFFVKNSTLRNYASQTYASGKTNKVITISLSGVEKLPSGSNIEAAPILHTTAEVTARNPAILYPIS